MVDLKIEGSVLSEIIHRRLNKQNQNFLMVVSGKTGSGKSWACLRIAELWYQRNFKKPFPIENICFSPEEVFDRLVNGGLKKGEILILEEAGVSMGNLDFQNKISKMFNYMLQTFRNQNIGLILNLPILDMLNKQTKLLLHFWLKTYDIDYSKKKTLLKPYHLIYSQRSGKILTPFPRVIIDGFMEAIELFTYSPPSKDLLEVYEKKKSQFVSGLQKDILYEIKHKDKRKPLTEFQEKIVECWKKGMTKQKDIAKELGTNPPRICQNIGYMKRKGYYQENT